MSNIIITRKNKEIYYEDGICYKVFEKGYSKADILNEALIHARAEETGLPVPRILAVDTIYGKWAILTEYIQGHTIEELIATHPEKTDEYLNIFVDTQIDIQSHSNPLLNLHTAKMNRKISETDLSATLRYDLHNRIESMPKYHHFCHGDYNPSNVIIGDDGKVYVVDWAHATQGNNTADAARTYLILIVNGKEELAKKYLKLFIEKSKCDLESIISWLPILAASQSVKKHENEYALLTSIIYATPKELMEKYGKI